MVTKSYVIAGVYQRHYRDASAPVTSVFLTTASTSSWFLYKDLNTKSKDQPAGTSYALTSFHVLAVEKWSAEIELVNKLPIDSSLSEGGAVGCWSG